MPWTTPGTATAGSVLTASFWNEQVRDNMVELNAFGLTVGSGTATQVGVNANDMTYDAATITLAAGRYLVMAGATITTNVSDSVCVGVWNNTTSALVTDSSGAVDQVNTTQISVVSRPVAMTITSSTVVRPRIRRNGNSTITVPAIPGGLTGAVVGWIAALKIGA